MRIPKIYTSQLDKASYQLRTIKLEVEPIEFFPPNIEDDEKAYIKLIKQIERLVRNSYEYRTYIKFLKAEIDMNSCSFFKKLTREDISIEIHHSPFTLFELVSIILNKHIQLEPYNYSIYEVAEEAIKLHYEGLVGLIPLSLTVHELVHAGGIYIPVQTVYGNVDKFYEEYLPYISNDIRELFESHLKLSNSIHSDTYKPSSLDRIYTYVEVEGQYLPKLKKIEDNLTKENLVS